MQGTCDWAAGQVYKATRGGVSTVAAKIMSSAVSDGSASTARTQASMPGAQVGLRGLISHGRHLTLLCGRRPGWTPFRGRWPS